ncbi:MAG: LysM peptidoglycan-binding domain-containing protein [Liquorilactobacillus hordei]|uniref:LysM peptidoglycan-binding domain-containing protein n=1 Tax=Liquorilactobacillus hordei TaxID=468911 RepID=UPI0039E8BE1E
MKKKITLILASFLTIMIFAISASANTLGMDVSNWQDSTVQYFQTMKSRGMSFTLVKLGGSGGGEGVHYKNPKASAQLANASLAGMDIGGYYWGQFGSSQSQAINMANMAIDDAQRVGLKTGSVIALDYEQGATSDKEANTQAIISFMETIQKSNYKAVLYSGADYLNTNINVEKIGSVFGTRIWVASYKTMNLQTAPDFRYFPSMNYVGMWQYGSNVYGVDGNVDLTGLMKSGDVKDNTPVVPTAPKAVVKAETVDNSNKYYVVVSGDSWWAIANKLGLDMNQLAQLNGMTVNTVIHPNQKLLIKGTLKNNVTASAKQAVQDQSQTINYNYYTVKSGDSWWAIANRLGINMNTLAQLNGKTINSMLYPNQKLKVSTTRATTVTVSSKVYYKVKSGDTVGLIAKRYGVSVTQIQRLTGLKNVNRIYIGQTLRIK